MKKQTMMVLGLVALTGAFMAMSFETAQSQTQGAQPWAQYVMPHSTSGAQHSFEETSTAGITGSTMLACDEETTRVFRMLTQRGLRILEVIPCEDAPTGGYFGKIYFFAKN